MRKVASEKDALDRDMLDEFLWIVLVERRHEDLAVTGLARVAFESLRHLAVGMVETAKQRSNPLGTIFDRDESALRVPYQRAMAKQSGERIAYTKDGDLTGSNAGTVLEHKEQFLEHN